MKTYSALEACAGTHSLQHKGPEWEGNFERQANTEISCKLRTVLGFGFLYFCLLTLFFLFKIFFLVPKAFRVETEDYVVNSNAEE